MNDLTKITTVFLLLLLVSGCAAIQETAFSDRTQDPNIDKVSPTTFSETVESTATDFAVKGLEGGAMTGCVAVGVPGALVGAHGGFILGCGVGGAAVAGVGLVAGLGIGAVVGLVKGTFVALQNWRNDEDGDGILASSETTSSSLKTIRKND